MHLYIPSVHGQLLCKILSRSNVAVSEGVIPGHGICLCVHGDLYLGNKTIGQDHGKSLGNGQQ